MQNCYFNSALQKWSPKINENRESKVSLAIYKIIKWNSYFHIYRFTIQCLIYIYTQNGCITLKNLQRLLQIFKVCLNISCILGIIDLVRIIFKLISNFSSWAQLAFVDQLFTLIFWFSLNNSKTVKALTLRHCSNQ